MWRNNLIVLIVTFVFTGLFSCGGTSETGNARIASISGSILVNDCDTTTVWVHLVNENYIPLTDTSEMVFKTAVNTQGDYSFQSIPCNNYYLYIKGSDQIRLRGPITITVPEVELGKDTLHYTSMVTVYTPDTSLYDYIFIKGTPEVYTITPGYTVLFNVPTGKIEVVSFSSTDSSDIRKTATSNFVSITQFDTLSIGLNNSAPNFDTLKSLSQIFDLNCSRIYQDTISANDPDSDIVYYHLLSSPDGMSCDSVTGIITWTVPDSIVNSAISLSAVAEDNRGASRTIHWTVTFKNNCSTSQLTTNVMITPKQLFESDTVTAFFGECYCSDSSLSKIKISWGNGDTSMYSTSDTVSYSGFSESGIYFVSGKLICGSQQNENNWFTIDSIIILDNFSTCTIIPVGQNPLILERGSSFVDPGAIVIVSDSDTITVQITTTDTVDNNTNGNYTITYSYIPHEGDTLLATRQVFVVSQDSSLTAFTLKPIDTLLNDSIVSITFSAESLQLVADSPYVRFLYSNVQISQWTDSMSISFPLYGADTVNIALQYLDPETFTYSKWSENYIYIYPHSEPDSNIKVLTSFDTLRTGEFLDLAIQGALCSDNLPIAIYVNWGDNSIDSNSSTHIFQHSWDTSGAYTVSILMICYSSSGADSVYKTKSIHVSGLSQTDTTPPVITLQGNTTDTISQGTAYIDSGATANDPEQGDLTSSIQKSGFVDTNNSGVYFIFYTVMDAAGNRTSAVRKIIVL